MGSNVVGARPALGGLGKVIPLGSFASLGLINQGREKRKKKKGKREKDNPSQKETDQGKSRPDSEMGQTTPTTPGPGLRRGLRDWLFTQQLLRPQGDPMCVRKLQTGHIIGFGGWF